MFILKKELFIKSYSNSKNQTQNLIILILTVPGERLTLRIPGRHSAGITPSIPVLFLFNKDVKICH